VRPSARVAAGALLLLGAAQFVPVARTNPPVESDVGAPPEVAALLRRACYDCHSHETAWPIQAFVAPISWLVAHDVREGREELNFYRWGAVDARRRARAGRKIREEVAERGMPPWLYLAAHPEARLADADRAILSAWAGRLEAEAVGEGEDGGGRRRRGRDR
jgi:hypothetical protein